MVAIHSKSHELWVDSGEQLKERKKDDDTNDKHEIAEGSNGKKRRKVAKSDINDLAIYLAYFSQCQVIFLWL